MPDPGPDEDWEGSFQLSQAVRRHAGMPEQTFEEWKVDRDALLAAIEQSKAEEAAKPPSVRRAEAVLRDYYIAAAEYDRALGTPDEERKRIAFEFAKKGMNAGDGFDA